MAKGSNKLEWCIVRLGQDMNWWVEEISDPITWDLDGLGIIDPRQVSYILDLLDPMREYGLKDHFVEEALFKFKIDKDLGNGRIRLTRIYDAILESEDPLFVLPDVIDDEKGPYADFLDHATKVRVKMLNDLIDFKKQLTEEELEDEIREEQQCHFLEGKAIHPFKEVTDILEYVPEGFELDLDEEVAEEAKEVSEEEFFYSRETGGTVVSSALELVYEIIQQISNGEKEEESDNENEIDRKPFVEVKLIKECLEKLSVGEFVIEKLNDGEIDEEERKLSGKK